MGARASEQERYRQTDRHTDRETKTERKRETYLYTMLPTASRIQLFASFVKHRGEDSSVEKPEAILTHL